MTTALPRARGREHAPSTGEIELVVSDRAEDVDAVLSVIHDGFVEAGFMDPQASERRLHPAYLNPGAMFALARIDGEPIGAATMIPDGPFGLPCERAFAEEVDVLRRGPGPIMECGSFTVRTAWRRHTRRVFVRVLAAFIRIAMEEYPDSPGLLTTTPEAERFHTSVGGFRRITDVRPLFGAPAVLLHVANAHALNAYHREGVSSGQRTVDHLTREPAPTWLIDRRAHHPLPSDWLAPLVSEQLTTTPFGAQLRCLYERYPEILRDLTVRPAAG